MTWYVDEDFSWLEEKLANDSVPAADINGLNQNNLQTWENMKALLGSDEEPAKTFIEIVADVAAVEAKVQLHDPSIMRTILSNDPGDTAHDIAFTAGWEIDSSGLYRMGGSAWTKRGDATWDEGNNAGALFSGADMAANTWYVPWKIRNDTDGSIDYGLDTYANWLTNLPDGYSVARRLGLLRTLADGNLMQFKQTGNFFRRTNYTASDYYKGGGLPTARTAIAVFAPPNLPSLIHAALSNASDMWSPDVPAIWLTDQYDNDRAPVNNYNNASGFASVSSAHQGYINNYSTWLVPNTSSQIYLKCSTAHTAMSIHVWCEAWIDTGI